MDRFVKGGPSKAEPEPLAVISSCLRSDPRLNDYAAALDQIVKATKDGRKELLAIEDGHRESKLSWEAGPVERSACPGQ